MKRFKDLVSLFKPRFWDIAPPPTRHSILYNYRHVWLFSVLLLITVSALPMTFFVVINYRLTRDALRTENHLRTIRITSNTRRTITFFLEERLDALRFLMQDHNVETMKNDIELLQLLRSLQTGFGGFLDLGLIDGAGIQINYVGPFDLKGRNYGDQPWFAQCVAVGSHVSDVFLGYRQAPHMVIAMKWSLLDGSFYILRATLDIKKLIHVLYSLDLSEKSDVFLCNNEGYLQTPSRYYGEVLHKVELPVPKYSSRTQVMETVDKAGEPILIGYAYIENSPYVLMLIKRGKEIMKNWYTVREELIWLFGGSIFMILVVVLSMSTYMVNKVYEADQTRLKALERLETSGRLISIGRLAAGVAHEINNPLAVIEENAGLIKDLFTINPEYKADQRMMELINTVLDSVDRCGEITKQLLRFARHFEPRIQALRLEEVILQVLMFFRKEASYRGIQINMDIPDDLPEIFSDPGRLQQIFFNLVNNSFQAMNQQGGRLEISAAKTDDAHVAISIQDSGCGISEEDQQRIFEPFFTTKGAKGGTGLGLSITYGLLRKLGGDISVRSKVGEGTTFTVSLPTRPEGEVQNANSAG